MKRALRTRARTKECARRRCRRKDSFVFVPKGTVGRLVRKPEDNLAHHVSFYLEMGLKNLSMSMKRVAGDTGGI